MHTSSWFAKRVLRISVITGSNDSADRLDEIGGIAKWIMILEPRFCLVTFLTNRFRFEYGFQSCGKVVDIKLVAGQMNAVTHGIDAFGVIVLVEPDLR